MRLEVLITKYLDGELTAGEDRELRQLLAQNPEAKNAFDVSVSLHHALRKDAGLTAPSAQVVRETEERVLMAILNHPEPLPQRRKERRFLSLFSTGFSTGSRILTGLVTVLLPLLTSTIGRESLPFVMQPVAQSSASVSALRSAGQEAHLQPDAQPQYRVRRADAALSSRPTTRAERDAGRSAADYAASGVALATLSAPHVINRPIDNGFMSDGPGREAFADDVAAQSLPNHDAAFGRPIAASPDIPLAAAMAGTPAFAAPTIAVSSMVPSSILPGDLFAGVFNNRVNLATTFGYDVLEQASGGSAMQLSFISQSLSYALGESDNAGVELGYLWFSYGKPVVRFIPAPSDVNDGGDNDDPFGYDEKGVGLKVLGAQGQSDAELPPSELDGEYINDIQVLSKQTWWGAAFYERTFTHNERISTQGRIGVGGSNDGALAYVRATGLYRVFDNVSLSLGVDARGMVLRTPYITPKSHTVKTSLSLIYGLQFHL